MQTTCTHIAIHAHDIEAGVSFYKRYAELKEVHRRTEHGTTVVWLAEPGREKEFVVVLIEASHADAVSPPPMAHIGYAVDTREKVDRLAEMARAGGVLVEGPVDAGGVVGYYAIMRDPDGNQVEFSHGQDLGKPA